MISKQADRLIEENKIFEDNYKIWNDEKLDEDVRNKAEKIVDKMCDDWKGGQVCEEKLKTLIKAYKEQLSVMHQVYLQLSSYRCGVHAKLVGKIQIQISVLRKSIKAMEDAVSLTSEGDKQ